MSRTDDTRSINYDRNTFIIQATGVSLKFFIVNRSQTWFSFDVFGGQISRINQLPVYFTMGLYYKHVMIISDMFRVIRMTPLFGASLVIVIDDTC